MSELKLNNMQLKADFTGNTLPNKALSAIVNSNVSYNLTSGLAKLSELVFKLDQLELKGWASVEAKTVTKVRFDLAGNVWDLEPYLGKPTPDDKSAGSKESTDTNESPASDVEPDLSALLGLDVKGSLTLAGLKASGLTLNEISSKVVVLKGKAQLAPLTAKLYQGNIKVNSVV